MTEGLTEASATNPQQGLNSPRLHTRRHLQLNPQPKITSGHNSAISMNGIMEQRTGAGTTARKTAETGNKTSAEGVVLNLTVSVLRRSELQLGLSISVGLSECGIPPDNPGSPSLRLLPGTWSNGRVRSLAFGLWPPGQPTIVLCETGYSK